MAQIIPINKIETDLKIVNKLCKNTRKKNIIIEDDSIQQPIKNKPSPIAKLQSEKLTIKLVKDLNIDDFNIQKPFLKWVGGKTQIINNIIKEMPIIMNNYYEIFLGGGCVLLALLTYIKNGIINILAEQEALNLRLIRFIFSVFKSVILNYN